MRVAIYSGSFNPLHIGHLSIMRHLTECGDYDRTYLVVSPQNPLKDASNNFSAQQRFDAACEAVARHPEINAVVDGIELDMTPPHYSIRTLDALREREPRNRFTLVMGADNLAVIRKWKDYQRILREYGVAVYPRQGFNLRQIRRELMLESTQLCEQEGAKRYRIRLLKAPMVDISSTQIREARGRGEDMSEYLM